MDLSFLMACDGKEKDHGSKVEIGIEAHMSIMEETLGI